MVHVITDNIFLLSDNFIEYYGNEFSAQKSFFFFLQLVTSYSVDTNKYFDGFNYISFALMDHYRHYHCLIQSLLGSY